MTMLGHVRQCQEDEKPEIRTSRPAKTSRTEDFYKAVMIQSQRLRLEYAAKAPLLHIIMLNFFAEAKILMSQKEQFWTRNSAQNTSTRLQQQYFKRLINVC